MQLFREPPATPYDLRFTFFGFPVRVHPLFWLTAFVLGFSSQNLAQILVWIPIVFASILFHELGHALAMRYYGQEARIVLYGAGGLTVPESVWWGNRMANVTISPLQEMLVAAAGPTAGFFFAGSVIFLTLTMGGSLGFNVLWGFIPFPSITLPSLNGTQSFVGMVLTLVMSNLLWVNIFWGMLNLMPVFPLDGGTIARYFLIQADPAGGGRKALWLSVITGGVLALFGLVLLNSVYVALLFGYLALQSYLMVQRKMGY